MDYAIRIKNLNKSFGAVRVLKDINMDFPKGKTIALVGENGAGKSTLMNILTGVYTDYTGEIYVDGKLTRIKDPLHAKQLGISQVFQRAELVPELSIAENIFLGEERDDNGAIVHWNRMYKEVNALLEKYHIMDHDSRTPVKNLGVADRHLVSIAKILQRDPEVAIFDEPTAVLSDSEVEILFNIIAELKKRGVTIVYISHRLEEIFRIADEIYILRDGNFVKALNNENLTSQDIIVHMLGRKMETMYPEKKPVPPSEDNVPVLKVSHITTPDVYDISFELYKGEILGLAGLVGSGRTELAKALFGLEKKMTGDILIDGKKVKISDPFDAIRNGIFLAPEDRKGEGLVLGRPIRENVTMANMARITRTPGILLQNEETELANKYKELLSIKAPDVDAAVSSLSGGNQQKVVLAKALMAEPRILILDEPTQGIDIGAKYDIYSMISRLASEQGMAILLISSEMDEIMNLCHRVIVMHNGVVTGEVMSDDVMNNGLILSHMYREVE